MRRNLIYIIPLISTLLSCSDDIVEKGTEYLNGSEKTPLAISVTAPITKSTTRAFDGEFEKDDVLKAYVRHVTATENTSEGITTYSGIALVSGDGVGPAWANMTVGTIVENSKDSDGKVKADNYTETGVTKLTLTPKLYWDDFSNSSSAGTDLRTSDHYLQSYYGYCFNGKTDVTLTNETEGTLTWTVASDQTSGFKTSDLLWSKTQDPVAYAHGDNNTITGRNSVLTIPYTHAMSKVTIVVKCEDGFDKAPSEIFSSSSIDLINMNTVATVTAPTQNIVAVPGDGNANVKSITMKKGSIVDSETEKKCTFEAIIVPTAMTNNKHLATINDVDGNKYDVNLTDAILTSVPDGSSKSWSQELDGTSKVTKPGVNYMLTVTIKKQEIKVEAKIADWEQVNAESEAEIKFTTDISGYKYDETLYPEEKRKEFVSGDKIDLYKNTETSFTDCSSIATYTAEEKDGDRNVTSPAKWTCAPVLYWDKEGDKEKFRAIYPSGKVTPSSDNKFTITAGEGSNFDLLWGTTAKHQTTNIAGAAGKEYKEGDPIDPRTKEVPLIFYHKTSKVKVVLRTPATEAEGKVTITSAKIQFTNLYTSAKVDMNYGDISNGDITPSTKVFTDDKRPIVKTSTEGVTATDDLFMIPQTIPPTTEEDEAAYIIITLSDNTTYKLKLRDCMLLTTDSDGKLVADKNTDGSYKYVTEWKEGETYTYYINVTKEKIQFFALIKDWKEVNVSGDATMEWDDTIAEDLEAGAPGAGDPDGNHNEERGKGEW